MDSLGSMWSRLLLSSCLLAVAGAPTLLRAQEVIGRVEEEGSDVAVPGAFVVLLNTAGERVAAVLAGDDGGFRVRVASPGAYRIRVDRIGYRSTTSDPFLVGGEGAGPLTIRLPGDAIRLPPIEVEGARRCVLRPEEGEATHALFGEARKALEITEWASAEGRFVFDVLRFTRYLPLREMVVDTESVEVLRIAALSPFHADSTDLLLSEGFIRGEGGDRRFYGPDAALLLSDAFLDRYCFRRVAADSADLLGLAFEPVEPRDRAEVEGVLWLARATAHLRFLEFRYANARLPRPVNPERFGGIVRFRRMLDGSWIISDWRIRFPVFYRRGRRVTHEAFTETEGSVFAVRTRDGREISYDRVAALLIGRVLRRRGAHPVAGARVRIVGTRYETVTDADGWFGFEGLPEGHYRIEADGDRIRRVDATVHVRPGETTELVLSG